MELTSVEDLTDQIRDRHMPFVMINLSEESNIPSLTWAVQAHLNSYSERVKIKSTWMIGWCGDRSGNHRLYDSAELINLIRSIGTHSTLEQLSLKFPFHPGDASGMAKALHSERNHLRSLRVSWVANSSGSSGTENCHQSSTKEMAELEKDVLGVLDEARNWKGLENLILSPQLPLDHSFIKKLSPKLPKLELLHLSVHFQIPFAGRDVAADSDLVSAFASLRDGLELNYSLHRLEINAAEVEDQQLKQALDELNTNNFSTLLDLNAKGGKNVISMPLHRDTWLEIVSQYSNDLNATYYYLRRNTWMFTTCGGSCDRGGESLVGLRDELGASGKRHQEELKAKDLVIQRLREEMEAKEKRHMAELHAKDLQMDEVLAKEKRHEAELNAKDLQMVEMETKEKRYKAELHAKDLEMKAMEKRYKAELQAKHLEIMQLQKRKIQPTPKPDSSIG